MGKATPLEELLKVASLVFYKNQKEERALEKEKCKEKRQVQFLTTLQGQRPMLP